MTTSLLSPSLGLRQVSRHWFLTRDGDDAARSLFDRHYSRYRYADGRQRKIFVGPGEKMVLLNEDGSAMFVWRKFLCDIQPNQVGVNCAVFRNESDTISSTLIREADELAFQRWSDDRHWTLVNPLKIKSRNPGACFKFAGWHSAGHCKSGLVILAVQR